jgi:hypothetical protein
VKSANPWLLVGGCLSAAAAVAHVAVILGGPDWYRFFGAGEEMASMAQRGSWLPALLTAAIASVLAIWAAYAFAGAGLIGRLPLMRPALVVISAIYLVRGMFVFSPAAFARPDLSPSFMLYSSLIVLAYGVVHALGTWQAWPDLSSKKASA